MDSHMSKVSEPMSAYFLIFSMKASQFCESNSTAPQHPNQAVTSRLLLFPTPLRLHYSKDLFPPLSSNFLQRLNWIGIQQPYNYSFNFGTMAQCVSTRSPHKRGHGITNFIRNAILNDQRQLQKKSLIDDLLAKYKSYPRGNPTTHHKGQDGEANQLVVRVVDGKGHPSCLGVCLHYKNRISVENRRRLREELSKEKLRKRLSSDKNSESPTGRPNRSPSRRSKTNIFNHSTKPLGKNTEFSSFYKEALQQQNDKIKELCVCEQQQLARVLVQIDSEEKDQLFDRLVYEKSIDKLRRMASIGELGLQSCGLLEDSGEETQEETRRE